MRIMQVITRRQLRGAEVFAAQLSEQFVLSGHSVLIVGLQDPAEFPYNDSIEYVDLNIKSSSRFVTFDGWKRFSALVKNWRPDVIQANASETLKFTVMSREIFRWKATLIYRNANKVSDFIKSPLTRAFNSFLARRVDHVISVSENCRLDFVQTFGIPLSRANVIPIGTPVKEIGLDSSGLLKQYWINVASLVPEKNHRGLLSIYKQYRAAGGKLALKIVGDGRLRSDLMSLAVDLGIQEHVEFLGYRRDVIAIMRDSRGLLLPSLIEGLPGVILEAMALKIPVVAFGVGGIPEVIDNGRNGVLVEKGDDSSFVAAMMAIDYDEAFAMKIALAGYQTCLEGFDIGGIARRFINEYEHQTNMR